MKQYFYTICGKNVRIRCESSEFMYILSMVGFRTIPLIIHKLNLKTFHNLLNVFEINICRNNQIFGINF